MLSSLNLSADSYESGDDEVNPSSRKVNYNECSLLEAYAVSMQKTNPEITRVSIQEVLIQTQMILEHAFEVFSSVELNPDEAMDIRVAIRLAKLVLSDYFSRGDCISKIREELISYAEQKNKLAGANESSKNSELSSEQKGVIKKEVESVKLQMREFTDGVTHLLDLLFQ